MNVNVEVARNATENNLAVLRRFTKRVQGSGILPRVRKNRYKLREESSYKRKKRTLKSIAKKAETAELIKQGKISPEPVRFKRR